MDKFPITHAHLEEIELVASVLFQLFLKGDLLASINNGLLQALKDSLLFGCNQLLVTLAKRSFDVTPRSKNEKFLKDKCLISFGGNSKYSLLEIKTQIQAMKIMCTTNAALLNLVKLKNEINIDIFPVYWDYLSELQGYHFDN